MKTAFISSVVNGFETYRQSACSAVELMDYKPVISEGFGSRPYTSEVACITEVEQSDIYLLILGKKYGFETKDGVSVTQAEFKAAQKANRPILVFIQKCEMEPRQKEFCREVEAFHSGFFRAPFSTEEELKNEIVKGLRKLETQSHAIPIGDFESRVNEVRKTLSKDKWDNTPELCMAFLPQPEQAIDIVKLEDSLDEIFTELARVDLVNLSGGYDRLIESDWTGLRAGEVKVGYFPDGLVMLLINPTDRSEGFFSGHFVPPRNLENIARGALCFNDSNSGYVHFGLYNMDNTYVADMPNSTSLSMRLMGEAQEVFNNLFIPLTEGAYIEWVEGCIRRFSRKFRYSSD